MFADVLHDIHKRLDAIKYWTHAPELQTVNTKFNEMILFQIRKLIVNGPELTTSTDIDAQF